MSLRSLACALFLCAISAPVVAGSYASYHPDQHYFVKAVDAFSLGRLDDTARFLRQSARYGDKTSQFALALFARDGVGRGVDLAEAYAWLDVAAERGYPAFLVEREALWSALPEDQRERAITIGRALYADYGDEVAKPRLERLLRLGKSRQTGTRTGAGATVTGVAQMDSAARAAFLAAFLGKANPGLSNGASPGSAAAEAKAALDAFAVATAQASIGFASTGDYYDEANWEPALYWQMRDAPWLHARVTVRRPRTAEAPADDAPGELK